MAQKFLTNFTPPGTSDSYKFRAGGLFFGTTSNSTSAMTVSIPGVTEYYTGLTLILTMGAQPASGCTLNVNSLGAKSMVYGASQSGTYFASGATYLFVYDGTNFKAVHSYNSNTTYSAEKGITLSSGKFGHTNSITAKTTYNQSTTSPGYGGTFKITEPKYDAYGHITGVQVATITMPSAQTIPTSLKNPKALTVGSKTYDGSSAVTVSAADLGLSNALHFIGVKDAVPTTGTYANGDVILVGNKEYVYSGGSWIELGDESSFALKTITISGSNGLTGSGTLSGNITLSHADTSSQASVSASGRKYITGVTLDTYGHVTGLTTGTETVTDTHYTTKLFATGSSGTAHAATTNGNTYLRLFDNSTARQSIKIVGSGATTVTSDANGVITISSTDNNTVYSHPAGSGASKTSGFYKFSTDSTSHISGVTAVTKADITALGIPAQDTTYGSMSIDEGTTGTATTNRVLTAANLKGIINAHAPTKTGGGASGTWGISVTGSAGSVAWSNVTGKPSSFPPESHTHNYAGSSSAGGAANSVKTNLIIKLNGGTTEGTNLFTFNGSTAKTINITPAAIGASASGHTHTVTYKKASTATGNATATGTISAPTFTGTAHKHTFTGSSHNHTLTPTTATIKQVNSVGTMFKAEVSGEVLILTPGSAPTTANVTVYTGLTIAAATQGGTIANTTATGTVSAPTFTGTAHSHTITLTDTTVTSSGA